MLLKKNSYKIKIAKIYGQPFYIYFNFENYLSLKKSLYVEKMKIIDKLKQYKSAGLIGSISLPKNKTMQGELTELVLNKRIIAEAIIKLNKIFN